MRPVYPLLLIAAVGWLLGCSGTGSESPPGESPEAEITEPPPPGGG